MGHEGATGLQEPGEPVRVRVGLHLLVDGHLNPLLFTPTWFLREGLLRKEEVEIARETQSADSSFLAFNTSDFSLVVSLDSLEVFSNNEGMEPVIRDLMLNVFTLLRHTPLSTVTISRSAHLADATEPAHSPAWSRLLPFAPFEPILGKVAVADISIQGSAGPIPENSRVTISIQPSKVQGATLFVECRYTYRLPSDEQASGADALRDLLRTAMEITKFHSDDAINHISQALLTESA